MNNYFIAETGYKYRKGEVITDELYLGINDRIENWEKITDSEAEKFLSELEEKNEKERSQSIEN